MLMLTLEERGAYNTLLDLMYDRAGPVPDDARWLAGWMGVSVKRWGIIRAALLVRGKIYEVSRDGVRSLMNPRAAIEIENQTKRQRNAAETGAIGGRKRAENASAINENSNIAQGTLEGSLKLKTETETVVSEANASSSPSDDAPMPRQYPEPFELAWKAYPHVKGRSSKPKALGFWRRLPANVREQLPTAIARYAREGREPKKDCGAPAMDRWLRDQKFLDWLRTEPAKPFLAPDAAVIAHRAQHYRDTGEWKPAWGPKPQDLAA